MKNLGLKNFSLDAYYYGDYDEMHVILTHLTILEMQATLCENLHVEILSQILLSSAEIVAIMAVRQLPPIAKKKDNALCTFQQGSYNIVPDTLSYSIPTNTYLSSPFYRVPDTLPNLYPPTYIYLSKAV